MIRVAELETRPGRERERSACPPATFCATRTEEEVRVSGPFGACCIRMDSIACTMRVSMDRVLPSPASSARMPPFTL